jgi:hypothetical protein
MDMKRALRPRTYKWQTPESNARVILAALINPIHTYIHTYIDLCHSSSTDDPVTLGQLTLAVQSYRAVSPQGASCKSKPFGSVLC